MRFFLFTLFTQVFALLKFQFGTSSWHDASMSYIEKSETSLNMPITPEFIERRIYIIRGQKVMLDTDLAELYQVPTKRLNEQVKRNISRFPSGFMFQLSIEEIKLLNRSQFATGSEKHRDPRFRPYVFTEFGVAMLSSVLKSDRAVQMNIYIMRAFVKLREVLATHADLAQRMKELEMEQKKQGEHIVAVSSVLKQLMEEPVKENGKIGFVM